MHKKTAPKLDQRVMLWLPQSLIDHIDSQREDWRPQAEYIRNLIADDARAVKEKALKPAKGKPAPQADDLPTDAEIAAVQRLIVDDDAYWTDQRKPHDSDDSYRNHLTTLPVFMNHLAHYRAG